ncbi:(d)CMP kinase [Kineosporia succinea]|uniref:Cytidylate kinase n=1 Tax=Kineosporia succinea TaxID=84632 RepID=A0ABT9P6Q8_9ACTN|nr:(d)CMP kinase [Kineosporia succinea]MDP9828372.1 cytidylate kinase [Kineosporia succinea]
MSAQSVLTEARPLVIAVDGPSGSGKSSVSKEVARRLGLEYLDTGAMYRAATWSVIESGVDLEDAVKVAEHVRNLDLTMATDPSAPGVWVAGHDVNEAIRETRISTVVSKVATNLDVRAELLKRQRELIAAGRDGVHQGCVAEGRDITTVVAPDADVRILLTASEEARLARRSKELHGNADAASVEATRDQIVRRDSDDSTVSNFEVAADGVLHLDSSALDFEQTVDAVLAAINRIVTGSVTDLDEHARAGAVS